MAIVIDDALLEEIRDRVDLVDLVSRYVDLKKSGSSYMGLCPFHNEKTPSFHVHGDKGFYHCFGCGAGGDAISFLRAMEGLDFKEAVESLTERYNIPTRQRSTKEEERQKERERLFSINRMAARFFLEELAHAPTAFHYVNERGLSREVIMRFGLGYAPGKGRALTDFLLKQGVTEEELLLLNLSSKSERDGHLFDRFRHRLMFPILDRKGRVLGFGGRVLEKDAQPKYLNSRDTPIFHKGEHLYGLHTLVKESSREKILLVEGYMDVIGLSQGEIPYAVASLGTALTPQQAQLLHRYGKEIIICYDGDEAGQRATERAIDVLLSQGHAPRIMALPDGRDPDEYVREFGMLAFENEVKKAIGAIDYRILRARNHFTLETVEGKTSFLKEVTKILSRIESEIEREVYMDKVADTYKVKRQAIAEEVAQLSRKTRKVNTPPPERRTVHTNSLEEGVIGAQRQLLRYAMENREDYLFIKTCCQEEFWVNKAYYQVFVAMEESPWETGVAREVYLKNFVDEGRLTYHDVEAILSAPVDQTTSRQKIRELFRRVEEYRLLSRRRALMRELEEGKLSAEAMKSLQELNAKIEDVKRHQKE